MRNATESQQRGGVEYASSIRYGRVGGSLSTYLGRYYNLGRPS